ncbi:unnamed protein product [Coregonus sp. 'balchen']|nr:unnamed protein product [Coregonus sp. 'balchen']
MLHSLGIRTKMLEQKVKFLKEQWKVMRMSHTLRSEDQEVELESRRILGKEVNLALVTPLPQWGQRLQSLREGLGVFLW